MATGDRGGGREGGGGGAGGGGQGFGGGGGVLDPAPRAWNMIVSVYVCPLCLHTVFVLGGSFR